MIITGQDIDHFRLLALRGMLSLECKGMHRHGRSAYAQVKSEFNLHGSKQRVLDQFDSILNAQGIGGRA
jgi:hypothetical protein